ncbi:phosphatase PAP2 family protein [Microvirga aerilata]|uniref:Phosphatase PAP2 family protein n=2 Tax=Microvirga aerilata TaxID=670292 RepID=A0A936ZAS2_9HYPH|nr:phosphatase PAP2 family protein [Microvirga aerilata]MBL0407226.1 phosphatase PAP2 family protein [Microvirga aerilata]
MKAFGWNTVAWRRGAVAAALAGTMMTGTEASSQAPRTEGVSTFVASRDEVRVPSPPDRSATEAELAELKRLTAERSSTGAERAAYWATGGSAYRWNAVAADEMVLRAIPTPAAARHMALVHAAVHDAVVIAFEQKSVHNRARPIDQAKELKTSLATPISPSYPSEHAAAAGAASEVLAFLFPDKADVFRAMAEEAGRSRSIAGVAFPSDVAAGLALGRAVGGKAVERGKADGFDAKWTGSVPTTPGFWTGSNAILPLAGTWKTWLIASGDALRPAPPPAYDSPQKKAELAELKAIQRTPAMTSHAWFWEWGAGGSRAWHLWNEQTSRKVLEYGLAERPLEAARAFALASFAVHDAVVVCWDAKYAYWAMRPSQIDPELKPLFPPPNHPSYPAAHACISTAAGDTLAGLFPRDAEPLRALAKQAADSRMWAGIHFPSDVEAGRVIGEAVAKQAVVRASDVPMK